MSTSIANDNAIVRRTATRAVVPPLLNGALRRMLLRIGCLLLLFGAIAGVGSLLQRPPEPCFVELRLTSAPTDWSLRETVAENDFQAFREGGYFSNYRSLPTGPATDLLVADQFAWLAGRPESQSVILYIFGTAFIDGDDELQVSINGQSRSDTISLNDILERLRRCPARGKLVVIDLMPPEDGLPWTTTCSEIARNVENSLDTSDDPRRIALVAYGEQGRSLVGTHWQRSGLGYYFEQALQGHADGALDGKEDGCVTARETAAYAQRHVERWAYTTQGDMQRPQVFGEGEDFALVTVPHRQRREMHETPTDTDTEYPKWLAVAWNSRAQSWDRGDYRLHPRTYCRMEMAILKAEEQWRGGRDPKTIQTDLNHQLQDFQQQLRKEQSTLPSAAAYSVGEVCPTESTNAEAKSTREKWRHLFSDIVAKTQGMPPAAANPVKQKLTQVFEKDTQPVADEVFIPAAFEVLASTNQFSTSLLVLVDDLITRRQPQPQYVETLLLRRLADCARNLSHDFDLQLAQRSLQVAMCSSQTAAASHSFPRTADERRNAWQRQHNGDFIVLRPGYGPAADAIANLQQAQKAFEGIQQESDALESAHATLDAALLRLPLSYRHLDQQPSKVRLWHDAIETASKLADALLPEQNSACDYQRIAMQATALRALLQSLEEPFTQKATEQLVRQAKSRQQLGSVRRKMETALRWPALAAEQRQLLVAAIRAVDAANYELLAKESEIRRPNSQPKSPDVAFDSLQASRAVCQLAGTMHISATESDLTSITAYRTQADKIMRRDDVPTSIRLRCGTVFPADRQIPWLDALDKNPFLARERALRTTHFAWLAEEFAYRAHDDTPVLNMELSRRFAAIASPESESYLHLLTSSQVQRPSARVPEVDVDLRWQLLGETAKHDTVEHKAARDVKVLWQGDFNSLSLQPLGEGATIRWKQSPSNAGCRGMIVTTQAMGRTWHFPLTAVDAPWGSQLQLLIAKRADATPAAATSLRLRPAKAVQPYWLSIANPTLREGEVKVEIPGVGSASVQLNRQSVVAVSFPPPKKGIPLPVFENELPVRIIDTKSGEVLTSRRLPLEVVSPSQYVRVLESRFFPGEDGDNELSMTMAADGLPPGPPCVVEMKLSGESVPGLVSVTSGRLRGELPSSGEPLTLNASGLELIDGVGTQAEFSLTVDGVPRALTFAGAFSRRGDPTTPRQVARPQIGIDVPQFALAGAGFRVPVHVIQGPSDAAVHLRIGKIETGGFVSQLHQKTSSLRQQQVQVSPQPDGSLAFTVSLSDWTFDVDTSGMVGQHVLIADIVDPSGRSLASARQEVILDDSPAEIATISNTTGAVINQPIPLQINAFDSLSGIKQVRVFPGRPMDDNIPAGVKPVEAEADGGNVWVANLPPEKIAGPVEFTAQVINGVGLAKFVTTRVRVIDESGPAGGTVQGTVVEGPRPQPSLTVQLLSAGKVSAKTTTNAQGIFEFAGVKPGEYEVHAEKPASGRKAKKSVTVKSGKATQADLSLAL